MTDQTHDPNLKSWVEAANAPGAVFPVQNLPFASFVREGETRPRLGTAIGDRLLDVTEAFGIDSMRLAMAMEKPARVELRQRISRFLTEKGAGAESLLMPIAGSRLTLPCPVGDYAAFRGAAGGPRNKWLPEARNGRASSIVLAGAPVTRPWGPAAGATGAPVFTASRHLDFEAGLGAFLGPGNRLGETIAAEEAGDHLFGVTLLNGWVARDLENWEGQAFLSRNFATSMTPWVVTMEALEPFRKAASERVKPDPPAPAHLDCGTDGAFGVTVEARVKTAGAEAPGRSRRGDLAGLYWTLGQMAAHLASNGCAIRPGDLLGTGPLALGSGRGVIEDGDEVTLRGYCEAPGFVRIGLGQCRSVVRAAAATA